MNRDKGQAPQGVGGAPWWVWVVGALMMAGYASRFSRYAMLGDDCYISFRYAQNLVAGHGLVWNPGERVEGYTHLLWVLLIAAGMRLGIDPGWVVDGLGFASGLAVILLVTRFMARRHGWSHPLVWLVPFALLLNRSFIAWSSGGLATMLFTAFVVGGVLCAVEERARDDRFPWRSSMLFVFAELTRPEGGLFMFAVGLVFLADVLRRRRRWSALMLWCLPFVFIVGAHFLWRYSYYGEWLPNTFYAKVHGAWWAQSKLYFGLFFDEYHLHYFLPLALAPPLLLRRHADVLMVVVLALYLVYVAYIGGDRFEFRFMVVVLPLYLLLVAEGVGLLPGLLARTPPWLQMVAMGATLLWVTHLGSQHPDNWAEPIRKAHTKRWRAAHIASLDRIGRYASRRAKEGRALRALVISGELPADLRIATGGAGALPYHSELWTLDYYGLNDAHIARKQVKKRGVIAHELHASVEYMRQREVDAFAPLSRLVFGRKVAWRKKQLKKARGKVRRLNRQSKKEGSDARLTLACRELPGDRWLIFATPLGAAHVQARLGHLRSCLIRAKGRPPFAGISPSTVPLGAGSRASSSRR